MSRAHGDVAIHGTPWAKDFLDQGIGRSLL